MKKYLNILLIIFFTIIEIFILSKSNIVITTFNKALNICLYSLMPTMFLSILISQILISLHFEKYIPKFIINFFKYIFNINDSDVIIFLLSIISGYPNNSKILINNNNLNNIIQYTNFVNPIFLIVTVGSIYLKNIKLAFIILLSQYISNITIGIMLRNKNKINNVIKSNDNNNFLDIYYSSLKSTIFSLAVIFSNILFFSIINALVTNIININPLVNSILTGLIEFSNGIFLVSKLNIDIFYKGLIILCIIVFSSFSMHMQIMSINEKIKYIKFLSYRIFNVFISIIIYIILFRIFL